MRNKSNLGSQKQVASRVAFLSLGLAAGLAVLSWLVGQGFPSVIAYLVVLSTWVAILAAIVWLGGKFLFWFRGF